MRPYLFTPGRRPTARVVVKIAGKELIAHFDYEPHSVTYSFVPVCAGLRDYCGTALPTPEWLRKALSDQYTKVQDQISKEKVF